MREEHCNFCSLQGKRGERHELSQDSNMWSRNLIDRAGHRFYLYLFYVNERMMSRRECEDENIGAASKAHDDLTELRQTIFLTLV